MDLGNLTYIIFPLYLILLYLTIYDKYQYITMPLIAFINILVILSVMYGTFEPSNMITIIINLALIGGLFYFFANQSITWLLSVLFIGAASMGVENPITYFNNNVSIISMSVLSIAIIMAAVAVSKIQSDISNTSNNSIPLPKTYREGFEEIKSALLACLGLTVIVLGLNNTVVSGLENPSTESTESTGALTEQQGSVLGSIFTMLIFVFSMIYNGIKTVISYGITNIQYIINTIFNIISTIIIIMPLSLFMNTDNIKPSFLNIIDTTASYIMYFFNSFIRYSVLLIVGILNIIYQLYDMVIGSQYSKAKSLYTSVKPRSIKSVISLIFVVSISAFNLNMAISQLYNGFKLIQLPSMLNI